MAAVPPGSFQHWLAVVDLKIVSKYSFILYILHIHSFVAEMKLTQL